MCRPADPRAGLRPRSPGGLKQGKAFFFVKKKQKTFVRLSRSKRTKVFWSFFQKRTASLLPFGTIRSTPGSLAIATVTAPFGHTPKHFTSINPTSPRRPLSRSRPRKAVRNVSRPSGPKPPFSFLLHLRQISRTSDQPVSTRRTCPSSVGRCLLKPVR